MQWFSDNLVRAEITLISWRTSQEMSTSFCSTWQQYIQAALGRLTPTRDALHPFLMERSTGCCYIFPWTMEMTGKKKKTTAITFSLFLLHACHNCSLAMAIVGWTINKFAAQCRLRRQQGTGVEIKATCFKWVCESNRVWFVGPLMINDAGGKHEVRLQMRDKYLSYSC